MLKTLAFIATSAAAVHVFNAHAGQQHIPNDAGVARDTIEVAINSRQLNLPQGFTALSTLAGTISAQLEDYGALSKVPAAATTSIRNDMYLTDSAITALGTESHAVTACDMNALRTCKAALERGTRYMPNWVKVSVAVALGLGTMVANGSGLLGRTIRKLARAWILTLPGAIALSAFLFFVFRKVI